MISYMIIQKDKTPCLQLFALDQIIWLHPNPPNTHRYQLITKNLKLIFGSKLLQITPPRSLSSPCSSPSAQSSLSSLSVSLSFLPSPLSQQQIFNYQLQHSLPPLSIVICTSDQQYIKFFKQQLSTRQHICKKCIILSLGEGESKRKAKDPVWSFQNNATEGQRQGDKDVNVLANLKQAYDTAQVIKEIDQYLLKENQQNLNKIKQIFNIPIQEPEPIDFQNKISSDIWQNSGIQGQWQIDNQNSQQREQISFIDKFIKKQQQQKLQPKQQTNPTPSSSVSQAQPQPNPSPMPLPEPPLDPCQQLQTIKAFLSKQPYIRIDDCLCVFVYVHHVDNKMGDQAAIQDLPQSDIRLMNVSQFIQCKGKKEQEKEEEGEGKEKTSIVVFSGAVTPEQETSILAIQNLYKWIKYNSPCSKPSHKVKNVESIQQMLQCLQQIQTFIQNQ